MKVDRPRGTRDFSPEEMQSRDFVENKIIEVFDISVGGITTSCGDGTCNGAETCSTCPTDCGACTAVCGDGSCNGAETCSTCPIDCGQCVGYCGDGSCSGTETCSSCPADCGACTAVCGDGTCNGAETCSTCPSDCGTCTGPLSASRDLPTSASAGTPFTVTMTVNVNEGSTETVALEETMPSGCTFQGSSINSLDAVTSTWLFDDATLPLATNPRADTTFTYTVLCTTSGTKTFSGQISTSSLGTIPTTGETTIVV